MYRIVVESLQGKPDYRRGLPKIGGVEFFGFTIIRMIVFGGLYWGPPFRETARKLQFIRALYVPPRVLNILHPKKPKA